MPIIELATGIDRYVCDECGELIAVIDCEDGVLEGDAQGRPNNKTLSIEIVMAVTSF